MANLFLITDPWNYHILSSSVIIKWFQAILVLWCLLFICPPNPLPFFRPIVNIHTQHTCQFNHILNYLSRCMKNKNINKLLLIFILITNNSFNIISLWWAHSSLCTLCMELFPIFHEFYFSAYHLSIKWNDPCLSLNLLYQILCILF